MNKVVLLAIPALLALSCSGDDNNSNTGTEPPTAAAVTTYSEIVAASYADSHAAAVALESAIDDFFAAPDDAKLEAARQAWLDSREPYLQTEVYRFYDGPIDDPDDGPEGLINAWPLDENYIDYTVDEPTAGIISDLRRHHLHTHRSRRPAGTFARLPQLLAASGPGAARGEARRRVSLCHRVHADRFASSGLPGVADLALHRRGG